MSALRLVKEHTSYQLLAAWSSGLRLQNTIVPSLLEPQLHGSLLDWLLSACCIPNLHMSL